MTRAPWLALKSEVIAQQERLDTNPISPYVLTCRMSCPDKVAECFMQFIGHPDVGEFAGPMQPCQRDSITPIVFDAISGLAGRQRRRTNLTSESHASQLTLHVVAARSGLIDE